MRLVFMGSAEASAVCLRALMREPVVEIVGVVTQPDRPAGRGKVLSQCPCKAFALLHGLKNVISPENVNDPAVMAQLYAWHPDVIAVVAFGQFLKKPLLQLPPRGCINCHFSLLPKYRGASPVTAAIAAGEKLTGVTVMRMGEGMDDGPIMLQAYEPIYSDATGGSLMRDLALTGGVTLAKAIRLMAAGALPPEIPQVSDDATFAPKLKKTDGLIDWTAPVLVTERRIRAYHPWPCCYTFLPQRLRKRGSTGRIAVLKAEICPGMDPGWREAPCGTVVKTTREGPIVKCGDTALRLLEVKPEGSGAMSAGAFLLGRPLAPGDILGE